MKEFFNIALYALILSIILYLLFDIKKRSNLNNVNEHNCKIVENKLIECEIKLKECLGTNIQNGFRGWDFEDTGSK